MEFNPSIQKKICSDKELCVSGDFFTLGEVSTAYGIETAVAWLIPQLVDLSEFCGSKEKLQGSLLEECAWIIAQTYTGLKVSEVMLFFYEFKQGLHGHFYGVIDPLKIIEELKKHAAWCDTEHQKKRQEEDERERIRRKRTCVTREQYEEMKRRGYFESYKSYKYENQTKKN